MQATLNQPDMATMWAQPAAARAAVDRWRGAGAQLPVLVLPPDRPLDELDHVLTALAPITTEKTGTPR